MKKILYAIFFLMLLIITAEGSYYLGYRNSQNKQPNTQNVAQTPKITPSLTEEDINILKDPYYSSFLPLSYNSEADMIYINNTPKSFINWRKKMGIDFASWVSVSTYTKGQVDSMILTSRLQGTISDLNTNKIMNGKRYLSFKLVGKDNTTSDYNYNEGYLNAVKVVKLVQGKEIPINLETDLKNGDKIVIEEKSDLTKPPKDPLNTLEAKFIKL
jgi:hypothetical protein